MCRKCRANRKLVHCASPLRMNNRAEAAYSGRRACIGTQATAAGRRRRVNDMCRHPRCPCHTCQALLATPSHSLSAPALTTPAGATPNRLPVGRRSGLHIGLAGAAPRRGRLDGRDARGAAPRHQHIHLVCPCRGAYQVGVGGGLGRAAWDGQTGQGAKCPDRQRGGGRHTARLQGVHT